MFNCPYMQWNYPKPNSAALCISKTSILGSLYSHTTILTSRTARTAGSVEGTRVVVVEPRLHVSANPLNGVESLETTMTVAVHAQEKPKAKERRLTKKNVKRVYEELDNVDELLQDVLNVRSLTTNKYALSCERFLQRPKASD